MKKKIPLITCALIAAFLFVFFKPSTSSLYLPEDLLFQGRPIHPSTIVAALFGDSSRFEPHPIGDNERSTSKIKLDAKTHTVTATYNYPSGHVLDAYSYISNYKDKHIVRIDTYDTSGTGRFSYLGLVKRVGNTIVNAGELAGGDRFYGGVIKVESLKGNILRYHEIYPIQDVFRVISDTFLEQYDYSPMGSSCFITYEVNLDDDVLTHRVCGMHLEEGLYDEEPIVMTHPQHCFAHIANLYIKQGKKNLNLAEAKQFVEEVIDLTANLVKR